MKKLCIGTFLRILCDSKLTSAKQYLLINSLFKTVKDCDYYLDSSVQNHLMVGSHNLVDYNEILTCDKQELVKRIKSNVEPYFNKDGKKLVIICIRDVLKEDSNIDNACLIGFEEGYTKQDIVYKQIFNFSELIANVFYYCATQIDNISFKERIKEIKGYTKQQIYRINEIVLDDKVSIVQSKIEITADQSSFKTVFKEIADSNLSLPNSNNLKIYRLDVVNSKIDYFRLEKYILKNIGSYIYCRGRMNRYNIPSDYMILAKDAFSAYRKGIESDQRTNHFNEIMLYFFLECVLNAPKIFSKMELQEHSGIYDSSSSGIHILTYKKDGRLLNQLVYGATGTVDTLESAVDNAFTQIIEIKNHIDDEYELVKEDVLNTKFDTETNKVLENIIIPSKKFEERPDNAFGIFLGYTINMNNELNNERYKTELEINLNNDIKRISPYIQKKIEELELSNYSFYIYILPFNDIKVDKDLIMKRALEF